MPGNFKTIPDAVISSWPQPNYVDPVRRTYMPAFVLSWQIASTILVSGRFYLRARNQAGGFGLDDLMTLIGWLFSIGFTTTAWLNTERYNLDRHTWDVHRELFSRAALVGWVAQIMFICSTIPTKLSVLLFYRRMVKESLEKRWLYAIYIAISVTAGYGIAIFIVYFFTCQPLDAMWKAYEQSYTREYTCVNGNALTMTVGIASVISDIYAVALPCLILRHYNLRASRRQEIALNLIFAMGLLVAGAGMGRTYYLWKVNTAYDTSWNGFSLLLWSTMECQLAIIIACIPSCRAFFRHYLRANLRKTTFGSSVSYYGGGSEKEAGAEDCMQLADLDNTGNKDVEHQGDRHEGSSPIAMSPSDSFALPNRWESAAVAAGPCAVHSSAGSGLDEMKIRTAEEYELYAVERLNRHSSIMSTINLDLDVSNDSRHIDAHT